MAVVLSWVLAFVAAGGSAVVPPAVTTAQYRLEARLSPWARHLFLAEG